MPTHAKTLIAMMTLMLCACGGGGSSASPQSSTVPSVSVATPPSLVGIYDVDYGQFKGVYTFLEDGKFSGMHATTTIFGHPYGTLSATSSIDDARPITWVNYVVVQFGHEELGATLGRSLKDGVLSLRISSAYMGSLNATVKEQKTWGPNSSKTLYFDPIPLDSLAGNYLGDSVSMGVNTEPQFVSDFVLDRFGNYRFSWASCNFQGNVKQHGNTGVFDASVTPTGSNCKYKGALSGIAIPISFVNNKAVLSFQLDSPDRLQSLALLMQAK